MRQRHAPLRISTLLTLCFLFAVTVNAWRGGSLAFQSRSDVQSPHSSRVVRPTSTQLAATPADKEKTGLTPAQKAIQKAVRQKNAQSNNEEFDRFKKAVYGGSTNPPINVTPANRIPTKPASLLESFKKPASSASSTVVDGYADRVKQSQQASTNPLNLLKKDTVPKKKKGTLPVRDTATRQVFESVKGAVYGTVDVASKLVSNKEEKTNTLDPNRPKIKAFKPVAKSKVEAPKKEVLALQADLKSSNPVKRVAAEWKLKDLERKEAARIAALQQQETLRKIKENVYKVGDVMQATYSTVVALPGQVAELAETTATTVQSIPEKAQAAYDTVVAVPGKVQEKAQEVQTAVQETVETTKKVAKEVQSIPDKIRAIPVEAQKKAQETQQTIRSVQETLDEATTTTKVLLGLEKPKPRPPKTPPPKPPDNVGAQIAGTVASGLGKAAWWMGKGAVSLTVKGAQVAVQKGAQAAQESDLLPKMLQKKSTTTATPPAKAPAPPAPKETAAASAKIEEPVVKAPPKETPATKAQAAVSKETPAAKAQAAVSKEPPKVEEPPAKKAEPPKPPTKNMADLDKEVAEALKLAAEALEEAEEYSNTKQAKKKDSESSS